MPSVQAKTLNARITEVLDSFTPEGDFSAPAVARATYDWLLANDPNLLRSWAQEQMYNFLRVRLGDMLRHRRHSARRSRSLFEGSESRRGDEVPIIGMFSTEHVVDDQGTRRYEGDLTHDDLLYVARDYGQSKLISAFHERWYAGIARRVTGEKQVSDVFSEEAYEKLYFTKLDNERN